MNTKLRFFLAALFCALFARTAPGCASGEVGFAGGLDAAAGAGDPGAFPSDDATVPPTPPSPGDDGAVVTSVPGDAYPPVGDSSVTATAPTGPPFDAGEGGVCARAPGPGALRIVELMIESTQGTGDHGEWLEVASALDCAVNLNGLTGTCPSGAKVSSFSIGEDFWIPARGTFLVADSTNPAVNHALPGPLVSWSGKPGDVLRNDGATVTLLMKNEVIDSVTYPKLKLTPGVSLAFPSDCAEALRPDWSMWQASTASWFPAFAGTPNATNLDVHCPTQADR